jgi:hypothetical protein
MEPFSESVVERGARYSYAKWVILDGVHGYHCARSTATATAAVVVWTWFVPESEVECY